MKKELLLGLGLAAGVAGFAQEGVTPESKTMEKENEAKKEIVMQQDSTRKQVADTISRYDVTGGEGAGIEPDPIGGETSEGETSEGDSLDQEQQPSQGRLKVHGMLQVGTGVAGDAAEVCSDKATLVAVVDLSDSKTGLGFTTVRLDDFHNDPECPLSRVTVLNPHLTKNFGKDGKFKASLEGKYTIIDHLPQANGFSPDVVLSYTTDGGRTFEGMYAHKFKTGEDSDAFRLTVSKRINEALTLTGQGWYETGYDKKFYGRIIVDVNLGNGFGAQLSCIAKYGKLTPTAGVIYQF